MQQSPSHRAGGEAGVTGVVSTGGNNTGRSVGEASDGGSHHGVPSKPPLRQRPQQQAGTQALVLRLRLRHCDGCSRAAHLPQVGKIFFLSLVAKFIGPLAALAAYFIVLFVTSTVTISRALTLSSVGLAASQRASCTREVDMDIRRALMAYADRPFAQNQYSLVDDTAQCVLYHMKLLAFGRDPTVPDRGAYAVHSTVVESGSFALFPSALVSSVYDAVFSDACPFIAGITTSDAFTMERCNSFDGGIINQGLYALGNEYATRIGRLNDRRLRSRFVYNWTNYTGFIENALYYNRSQDACVIDASCVTAASFVSSAAVLPPPPDPDPDYNGDVPANFPSTAAAPPLTVPYSIADEAVSADMEWVEVRGVALLPAACLLPCCCCCCEEEKAAMLPVVFPRASPLAAPCCAGGGRAVPHARLPRHHRPLQRADDVSHQHRHLLRAGLHGRLHGRVCADDGSGLSAGRARHQHRHPDQARHADVPAARDRRGVGRDQGAGARHPRQRRRGQRRLRRQLCAQRQWRCGRGLPCCQDAAL